MQVKLISITSDTEKNIAYCARVSSPNQENPDFEKLLRYLIKHKHWSPFEMGTATVEIITSRAIAAQILRHRSFSFQEFSQRYAEAVEFELYEARRQDTKNKQNSIDDMSEEDKIWFSEAQKTVISQSLVLYRNALNKGIAKEQARFLLPLNTQTKLYMTGSIRSWIHYIDVRGDASTQKEHRDIALAIKDILVKELPTVARAMEWTNERS